MLKSWRKFDKKLRKYDDKLKQVWYFEGNFTKSGSKFDKMLKKN